LNGSLTELGDWTKLVDCLFYVRAVYEMLCRAGDFCHENSETNDAAVHNLSRNSMRLSRTSDAYSSIQIVSSSRHSVDDASRPLYTAENCKEFSAPSDSAPDDNAVASDENRRQPLMCEVGGENVQKSRKLKRRNSA